MGTCTTCCEGKGSGIGLRSLTAISTLLALWLAQAADAKDPTYRNIDMHDQAIQESLIPIRPGIPGERPFWNVYARRFINVPAFDFKPVDGAGSYRFTATSPYDKTTRRFESAGPNALLTPIWLEIPVGSVELKCEGLDEPGGKVIGLAGTRKFEKGAVFNGPYYKPEMGYKQSGELGLRGTLEQSYVRCWLKTGKPDPTFQHYAYPCKIIGAVIAGAAAYWQLEPRPDDAKEALEIGRKAADYLMSRRQPEGAPFQYFPPTYEGKQWVKHAGENVLMMIYPAEAAEAYLDLYDVVKDSKCLDAAQHIANTYARTQLANGAWYLLVDVHTGKPVHNAICIPTAIIQFLERLRTQYGVAGYENTVRKAVQYVMDGPMQTFDWHGQFEDVKGDAPPYKNMSRQEVCQFAGYLLDNADRDCSFVPLAEELLRFAEDQFVVWEVAGEHFANQPGPGQKQDQQYWITPTVLEQYNFYVPVCRSMGMLLAAYQKAHKVTGKRIYLAKAKALADALTVGQKAFAEQIDGQFPTLFSRKGENGYPAKWINNAVYPAIYLVRFARYLADSGIR